MDEDIDPDDVETPDEEELEEELDDELDADVVLGAGDGDHVVAVVVEEDDDEYEAPPAARRSSSLQEASQSATARSLTPVKAPRIRPRSWSAKTAERSFRASRS